MPSTLTAPPAGWRVLDLTTNSGDHNRVVELTEEQVTSQNITTLLSALRAWADENNLRLHPDSWVNVNWEPWLQSQFWGRFQLHESENPQNESVLGEFNCTCGATHGIGSFFCGQCQRFLVCETCRVAGVVLYGNMCARCAPACTTDGCGERVSIGDGVPQCATCSPREHCSHCAAVTPTANVTAFTQPEGEGVADAGRNYRLCQNCTRNICADCGLFFPGRRQEVMVDGVRREVCARCAARIYAEQRAELERWEGEELPVTGNLVLPATDERPVRTISFELEFDGNGTAVAQALYGAGLIQGPERNRYSEQGRQDGRFPCILKSDASVSGGELVTYLIDLSNENHAAAVLRMTEVMKGCRDLDIAQFSERAGGHVHVDLHGLSYHDLWVLWTLFRYLELPLYYMAGAGHSYGHRSLGGSSYANPANIGPFGDLAQFWAAVGRTGRAGLHLENYTYALNNCTCGHTRIGRPESCTCDLGKATAEWRLWNAQITPRILHGWFALMQAITAYATDKDGSFTESDFPYLPWSRRSFSRINASERTGIQERLRWMFANLPLTPQERDSVLYTIRQSELSGLGDEFINSLMDVEQIAPVVEVKKKAKANPRTETFALAPQEVTVTALDGDYYDDDDDYYDDEDY